MKQLSRTLSLFLIAAVVLSACGFQLRGMRSVDVALQDIYIKSGNNYGELYKQIQNVFSEAGVTVQSSASAAHYQVNLLGERNSKRAVATTAAIRVSQYELHLEADFSLVDDTGLEVIPVTQLVTERIYTFDSTSLVGSNEEEATLLREMRADIAMQILRRVDASVQGLH